MDNLEQLHLTCYLVELHRNQDIELRRLRSWKHDLTEELKCAAQPKYKWIPRHSGIEILR